MLKSGAKLFPFLLVAACEPPPEQSRFLPAADAGRGKAAIMRAGCASCHSIEGIDWPRGMVAPPIQGMADRSLIAGKLPNRPAVLAAWVRNAPAMIPGTAMPAMPLTERESRDVAAYLYEIGG